jgi:hypothetical protein
MDPFQIFIRASGVPLIDTVVRATIPNEMLGASKYAFPANNKGAVLQKKTRPGRGKPSSPTLSGAGTQGTHNSLMAKKSQNQLVPVEKTLEPEPGTSSCRLGAPTNCAEDLWQCSFTNK